MDALNMVTAQAQPSAQTAATPFAAPGGEFPDAQPGQSFGQVMAGQTASPRSGTSGKSDSEPTAASISAPTDDSLAQHSLDQQQAADVAADAQQPADSKPTDAPQASQEDDAGRIAAAAVLLQWLAMVPQSVAPSTSAQSPVTGATPLAGTTPPPVAGALPQGSEIAGVTELLLTQVPSLPSSDTPTPDPGTPSQDQADRLSSLQLNTTTVSTGFQTLLGQTGQVLQSLPMAVAAPEVPRHALELPVGGQGWAEELGTRLAVMSASGEQTGSLKLSPEHLGPLEVQIRVQDDKATVVFGAQHADTRAALNEALPRLKDLFAASGLQLTDAGVSRDGARQALPPRSSRSLFASNEDSAAAIEPSVAVSSLRHVGLVDAIA